MRVFGPVAPAASALLTTRETSGTHSLDTPEATGFHENGLVEIVEAPYLQRAVMGHRISRRMLGKPKLHSPFRPAVFLGQRGDSIHVQLNDKRQGEKVVQLSPDAFCYMMDKGWIRHDLKNKGGSGKSRVSSICYEYAV
jgi:hypothetical protein